LIDSLLYWDVRLSHQHLCTVVGGCPECAPIPTYIRDLATEIERIFAAIRNIGEIMSCDICWYVERFDGRSWIEVNTDEPDRCYDLFARLANVRNDGSITPICEPRGTPKDTSVKLDDDGGFSGSWLTLEELLAHDWSEYPNFERILKQMSAYGTPQDVRAVFWFLS
jgi:hypothetical protein